MNSDLDTALQNLNWFIWIGQTYRKLKASNWLQFNFFKSFNAKLQFQKSIIITNSSCYPKVTFEWMYSGSTSITSSDANMTINGLKESKKGIFGGGDGKPWTDFLACEAKTDPWVFTLRPREGKLDETLRLAQKLAEDGVGVKI